MFEIELKVLRCYTGSAERWSWAMASRMVVMEEGVPEKMANMIEVDMTSDLNGLVCIPISWNGSHEVVVLCCVR